MSSETLEKTINVIELELRACGLTEPATQFLQDFPSPLHIDLIRDFDGRP